MRRLAWMALLVGCAGGGDGRDSYPPDLPLDSAYTSCEVDEDCVVVELGCCGSCNGGMAVATNSESEDEVVDRFSEQRCGNQDCTLMACPPWIPSCDDGTCAIERDTTF